MNLALLRLGAQGAEQGERRARCKPCEILKQTHGVFLSSKFEGEGYHIAERVTIKASRASAPSG